MDKSREIFWLFIFANVNLLLTATAAATQMEDRCARMISYLCLDQSDIRYHTEFLLVVCLPALIFHILGGGLLILYYKTCHPWREVGWEREAHCFGKLGQIGPQLTVETPYWRGDLSYKQTDIREEDSKEQENKKVNGRQCNIKSPGVQDLRVETHFVQDHNVQGHQGGTRPQDLQNDDTQYQIVSKLGENRNNGNDLFTCERLVENILINKEDEMSKL